jgi:hypothetical protein
MRLSTFCGLHRDTEQLVTFVSVSLGLFHFCMCMPVFLTVFTCQRVSLPLLLLHIWQFRYFASRSRAYKEWNQDEQLTFCGAVTCCAEGGRFILLYIISPFTTCIKSSRVLCVVLSVMENIADWFVPALLLAPSPQSTVEKLCKYFHQPVP